LKVAKKAEVLMKSIPLIIVEKTKPIVDKIIKKDKQKKVINEKLKKEYKQFLELETSNSKSSSARSTSRKRNQNSDLNIPSPSNASVLSAKTVESKASEQS
jgi:hypothetical protein